MSKAAKARKLRPVAQLTSHVRTPLFRNAYALMLSAAATSGLGVVYWVLAARLYSTDAVGLNSALISAMMFLSGLARLNLNDVLIRYIPSAGKATSRLVGYAYLISVLLALPVSLVFVLGLGIWSPQLNFLASEPSFTVWFVLAIIAWNLFALQDNALTGLRQTTWIPFENTVFAVTKIVLLLIFARTLRQYGIFASWTIPVLITLIPINLLIFKRLIPAHMQATGDQAIALVPSQLLSYVGGIYLASLFSLASTMLLPILVLREAGASANAYFYQPWMIASALQFITANMSTSLTVEAASDRNKLTIYSHRALVQTARLLFPMVVILVISASYILRVFGDSYAAEGTGLLQLLALAAVPNVINTLEIGVARVQQRVTRIVLIQGAVAILTLGLSYQLLQNIGIVGVGVAWLGSQSLVAGTLLLTGQSFLIRKNKTP